MLSFPRRLAALSAVALACGAAACVDSSRCDAVLASVERARAEASQRDAQLAWLRWQLAVFASDLSARAAADRGVLLQRLSALEAANTLLAQRLERAQQRGEALSPPPPSPTPPTREGSPVSMGPQAAPNPGPAERAPSAPAVAPLPAPPAIPPPELVQRVEAKAGRALGIDETSPY